MLVFLIAATSVDGFIAQNSSQISTKWTSQEDYKWFVARTKQAGVMVMGSTTFATLGRALKERVTYVMTRDPAETAAKYPELKGNDSVIFSDLTPQELLKMLEEKGYSEVAICGGSSIYSQFLKEGLATKLYLTIEPLLFGAGVPLFSGELNTKLTLIKKTDLSSQTLLLEYDVVHE